MSFTSEPTASHIWGLDQVQAPGIKLIAHKCVQCGFSPCAVLVQANGSAGDIYTHQE